MSPVTYHTVIIEALIFAVWEAKTAFVDAYSHGILSNYLNTIIRYVNT